MSESKRSKADVNNSSSNNDNSSDSDENSASDGDFNEEEIQVDFEGRTPIDSDCHGIIQLLQQVFLKAHVNCVQVANLIISQNYVGSVIDQSDSMDDDSNDEDDNIYESGTIFGITTVLNLTAKKDEPCINEIRSYLIEKLKSHASDATQKSFQTILNDDKLHIGYLINERFINIPAQISVPLLNSLNKEVNAARNKGMPFNFDYYVMIMKICRTKSKNGKPVQDHYMNPEEQVIANKALKSFEYSVANECDATIMSGDWMDDEDTLTPYRKIILLNAADLPQLIDDIQNFIKNSQLTTASR